MKSIFYIFLFLVSYLSVSYADDKPNPAAPTHTDGAGEAVDVSKITEKYWAQGKDTELGVVQNRKYTTDHRFELGVSVGALASDPFLSINSVGVSLGYHFSQYFSVHALAWRTATSSSQALKDFQAGAPNAHVYPNDPQHFYGLEFDQNFLYGKASLFGSAIIYVDLFLLGGVGIMQTDTGNDFTPFLGIGQQIYLNQWMALRLDYRLMKYSESVKTQNSGYKDRSNTTDAVTLGVSFFY